MKGKFNKEETNGLTLCLPDLPVCFNLCPIYNNQLQPIMNYQFNLF